VSAASLIGSLALALRDSHDDLHAIEWQVDELLESLFPGWRRRFPASRGWRFTPSATIDVYEAIESPAAAAALRRAGFETVVMHGHPSTAFLTCVCKPFEVTI
jgi:hypothetical protein